MKTHSLVLAFTVYLVLIALLAGCADIATAVGSARADLKRDGSYLYMVDTYRYENLIKTIEENP